MSQVVDYITDLVRECRTAGIRATADPRNVAPPCVLFTPLTLDINTFHGATAAFTALVLAPGPANLDAFSVLDLLAQDFVRGVIKDAERIEPSEFTPDNGPSYPALSITWTASLDWPDPCTTTP